MLNKEQGKCHFLHVLHVLACLMISGLEIALFTCFMYTYSYTHYKHPYIQLSPVICRLLDFAPNLVCSDNSLALNP